MTMVEGLWNSDWTKKTWNLPPYKSKEFERWRKAVGMTLPAFRKLPVYKFAVKAGRIKDDEWVG